jgi:hypothetical protein
MLAAAAVLVALLRALGGLVEVSPETQVAAQAVQPLPIREVVAPVRKIIHRHLSVRAALAL